MLHKSLPLDHCCSQSFITPEARVFIKTNAANRPPIKCPITNAAFLGGSPLNLQLYLYNLMPTLSLSAALSYRLKLTARLTWWR